MKRKVPLFVSLMVFVTTLLTFSACSSAAPTELAQQAVPTAQPQSVEDFVAQQFTATAVAEQHFDATQTVQAAFDQAVRATAEFRSTGEAALMQTVAAQTPTIPVLEQRIAFSISCNVYTMNVDGSDIIQVYQQSESGSCSFDVLPAWSSDNQRLAFTASSQGVTIIDKNGNNPQIVSVDARRIIGWILNDQALATSNSGTLCTVEINNTSNIRCSFEGAMGRSAVLTPDRAHFLFFADLSNVDEPPSEVFFQVTDLSFSTFTTLFSLQDLLDEGLGAQQALTVIGVHPNGEAVLILSRSAGRLFERNLTSGTLSMISTGGIPVCSADYSPDGTRIVFSKCTREDYGIYILDRNDGSISQIASEFSDGVSWSN